MSKPPLPRLFHILRSLGKREVGATHSISLKIQPGARKGAYTLDIRTIDKVVNSCQLVTTSYTFSRRGLAACVVAFMRGRHDAAPALLPAKKPWRFVTDRHGESHLDDGSS